MSVLNLDHYRDKKNVGLFTISFIGSSCDTPEGAKLTLSATMTVPGAEVNDLIEAVKKQGGIYIPEEAPGKTVWLLPWPCAAVRITPTEK